MIGKTPGSTGINVFEQLRSLAEKAMCGKQHGDKEQHFQHRLYFLPKIKLFSMPIPAHQLDFREYLKQVVFQMLHLIGQDKFEGEQAIFTRALFIYV